MVHNKDIINKLANKKFIIFSHSCENTTGTDDEFFNYLKKFNTEKIVFIKFPFFFSTNKAVSVKVYRKNKLIKKIQSSIKFYKPELISYIKDFFYGIYYGIKFSNKMDYFIGLNNLLVLIGIILKHFGLVKRVIYYMIDYTPIRFKNPVLNNLYCALDRFACYNADMIWPLHKKTLEGRAQAGLIDIKMVKFTVVPFGNNSSKYTEKDYLNYHKNKIVYFGGVLKSKGAELFVPLVKSLLMKGFSNIRFECIGGGDLEFLKQKVKNNNLNKYFNIHGRVENHHKVERILLGCGVAIAPYYLEDRNSFSYFCDPGKIKVYLGCGLPIVITDVPPIAKEIKTNRAGLIARYSPEDFAQKIIKIIQNSKTYLSFRQGSIKFGKSFSWEKIFDKAIDRL